MLPEDLEAQVVGASAKRKREQTSRHLGDPKIAALIEKIIVLPEMAEVCIGLLEGMERTNMRLLQAAATTEELISCREFAKAIGMLIKKMKRGLKIGKKQKSEQDDAKVQNMLKQQLGVK